jgi:hypothetical protein
MDVGSVATSSYNGIASVNIDGNTICSLFGIFDCSDSQINFDCNRDLIARMRQKLDADNLCFLIIDEVSTLDSKIIALLDLRLQQLFKNTLAFGGVPLIFAGDFNQLGPVQKTFLPRDMMKWASRLRITKQLHNPQEPATTNDTPSHVTGGCNATDPGKFQNTINSAFLRLKTAKRKSKADRKQDKEAQQFKPHTLSYRGCFLFSKLHRYHLSQQMRACEDKQHYEFVHKLSKGEPVQLQDILRYKHLTQEDIDGAPDAWTYAPVLVTTN